MDGHHPYTTANTTTAAYQPVPITSTVDHDDSAEITSADLPQPQQQFTNNFDDDENGTRESLVGKSNVSAMELEQETDEHFEGDQFFPQQSTPPPPDLWTLSFVMISICCTTPIVAGTGHEFFQLFGVYFVYLPFTIHLIILLIACKLSLSFSLQVSTTSQNGKNAIVTIVSLIDFTLIGIIYPKYLWTFMIQNLFTEVDGTISTDWSSYRQTFEFYRTIAITTVLFRFIISTILYTMRICLFFRAYREQERRSISMISCAERTLSGVRAVRVMCIIFQYTLSLLLIVLSLILLASASSAMVRFGTSTNTIQQSPLPECDPLDETECWLPFPSFHMLRKDNTTDTGYRVHLRGKLLPPLKRSRFWLFQKRDDMYIQPDFLNRLDGFSTMGPFLFYIDGLKEAHEAGNMQLKGSNYVHESTTKASVTLLLNVNTQSFIPHTAEIDYLDIDNPMVMIFPAQPLYHNQHYAVAVINALDANGKRLPPTNGMNSIHELLTNQTNLSINQQFSMYDTNRANRYYHHVIPSIEEASSFWFNYTHDPLSLQLLFDFHTISASSQLGPARYVRDTTMKVISSSDWNWAQHIRTNNVLNYNCDDYYSNKSTQVLARTVHAEMDVPWFLKHNPADTTSETKNKRSTILIDATSSGKYIANHTSIGVAKFVVHIPCSVQATVTTTTYSNAESQTMPSPSTKRLIKPIRAIMEFGHGLFGNRDESSDGYLLRMAQNEGYVVVAMDWRGMSTYDLLLVVRILISKPHQFESVRDNLIQGYGCKYALQHFARHSLLSMDWFMFPTVESSLDKQSVYVKTYKNDTPSHVFYGISQGGILGAGYTALSGTTRLIDRSIIGSGGTPFALIMTRSRDFLLYDQLLLINFYKNRHVRMLLSLVQMAWDSVEGSGVLAPPIIEPYPTTLLQAGLGDVIVSAYSSEVLGRAYNASLLQTSPHSVYGIPMLPEPIRNSSTNAVLTEIMYEKEFYSLPVNNNIRTTFSNSIHVCLRRDVVVNMQIVEFVNNANIINPCQQNIEACRRSSSHC